MDIARTRTQHKRTRRLWDSFEADREQLYGQYLDVPYAPGSGLSPEALEEAIARYLDVRPELPHVLRKAHAFRIILAQAQIYLDPRDPYPDKFNHNGLLRRQRECWHREAREQGLEADARWFKDIAALGIGLGSLDTGHISPGWGKMFSLGLEGLAEEAERHLAQVQVPEDERVAFWEAASIVCHAAIALSNRFADQAEALAEGAPEYRERLLAVAETCRAVPSGPPQTLHQALYFAWLMHELIEFEGEAVRSLGRFDSMFYPYYQADLEASRLTPEEAKALFKYYWIKSYARTRGSENGAHFALAGQTRQGEDAVNELTYLILEAREELNAPDPKFSVRTYSGSPDELYRRTMDMVRRGQNAMVLMNDDAVIPALVKRGKRVEDARTYLPIGCYEPAVDGLEAACTTNLVVNLAKGVELALHDGIDPLSGVQVGPHTGDPRAYRCFDDFYQAYRTQTEYIIERSAAAVAAHERMWTQINPSPLIASTIDDCLERGLDIGAGGCHYNAVGCVGSGLANAADSLLAIKKAVFEGGQLSMDELIQALDRDFEGDEPTRQYLINRLPKWGNGDPEADELARAVADFYCSEIHSYTNERGGPYQAALYSFTFQWTLGRGTGALPDGRKAGQPLAPGVGPMAGRDKAGVTALLQSVGGLDFSETPNGSVLDIRLSPSAARGPEGLEALVSLVKTFFQAGVFAIQFNIVDADTLRAAQRDPEAYATLQVRVAGYSAYFVNLSPEVQDHLIAQNSHQL